MNYVVVSVLTFAGPLVIALCWAIVALYRELRAEQRQHLASRLSAQAEFDMRARQMADRADDRLVAEVDRVHDFYRVALDRIGKTVQYGTPTPEEAVVDPEPTVEQRLGRAIEEDMIARGMESLRREYEAAGIRIEDAELRQEVIEIILGVMPAQEPASVRGLIDRAPVVPVA